MKNKIVTICGSMKFQKEMIDVASKLEKEYGWCVIQCVYNLGENLSDKEMENIKKAHFQKIDISDAIFVLNIGGYIGESTKNEIEYAKKLNKEIIYFEWF